MGKEESRALIRDHEVVYVYHNLIDKTGDTRDTEEPCVWCCGRDAGRAASGDQETGERQCQQRACHGRPRVHLPEPPLQDSDFLSTQPEGAEVLYTDRRFVLGRGLIEHASFKTLQPKQLGLKGDLQVQIPKSINRLRLKGSGSRFVHGGATLQEVVIPVISINKKRQSDVGRVEVELIGGGGKTITTGQLAVVLYQTEPVTEKRQPRKLRAGLYTLEGESISDMHQLTFDMASEKPS